MNASEDRSRTERVRNHLNYAKGTRARARTSTSRFATIFSKPFQSVLHMCTHVLYCLLTLATSCLVRVLAFRARLGLPIAFGVRRLKPAAQTPARHKSLKDYAAEPAEVAWSRVNMFGHLESRRSPCSSKRCKCRYPRVEALTWHAILLDRQRLVLRESSASMRFLLSKVLMAGDGFA